MDKKKILRWTAVPVVAVVAWMLANLIEFVLLQGVFDWIGTLPKDNWFGRVLAGLANSPGHIIRVLIYGMLVMCAILITVRVAPSHKRKVAVVAAVVATATPIVQEIYCMSVGASSLSDVVVELSNAWYWIGIVFFGSCAACKLVYDDYDY